MLFPGAIRPLTFLSLLFTAFTVLAEPAVVPHGDANAATDSAKVDDRVVACWGLPAKLDPRALPSEALGAIAAAIDAKRAAAGKGSFAAALPDALSLSFFRHGLPPAAKLRYPVNLDAIPESIPVARGGVDWDKVWKDDQVFESVSLLLLGSNRELLDGKPEAIKKEAATLSLAALEILKERVLRQHDKLTHERVAARAKQGDLSPPLLQDKKFFLPHQNVGDAERRRRHLEELKLYCPEGNFDQARLKDLGTLNEFLAKFGAERYPGKESAIHGLPTALRVDFLKLSPEARASYLEAVRTELNFMGAKKGYRPESTVLAHLLLSDDFADRESFTSLFLQAHWSKMALERYLKDSTGKRPGDFDAKVKRYQNTVVLRLERALSMHAPALAEHRWAEEMLLDYYQLAGDGAAAEKRDRLLDRAVSRGAGVARLNLRTERGAKAASVALQAHAALSPAKRAENSSLVNALAAEVTDEKQNPEWRKTLAYQQAQHQLGVTAMTRAQTEALKQNPQDLAGLRAKAIAHLSKVDDPSFANYETARYQLARMYLESSAGTNVAAALRAVEGLTFPKLPTEEEAKARLLDPVLAVKGKNESSVAGYLKAKLLESRLHLLTNNAEKIRPLLEGLERDLKVNEYTITDRQTLDAIARLQPQAVMQTARDAYDAGEFKKVIDVATAAIKDLEARVDELWNPTDQTLRGKQRDHVLELDIRDLKQLVLRAKIRSGLAGSATLDASPIATPAGRARFLANMDRDLGRLSGDQAIAARAQYRKYFEGMFKGNPGAEKWTRPFELLETKNSDVLAKHRFAAEAFSLLGRQAERTGLERQRQDDQRLTGEAQESRRDHLASAILFSSVEPPDVADLRQNSKNLVHANGQLANAKSDEDKDHWRRQVNLHEDLRRKTMANVNARQAMLSRSITEYRLASGGDPSSAAFEKASSKLMDMLKVGVKEDFVMGMALFHPPYRNHYAALANFEQKWRFDPRSQDPEWREWEEWDHSTGSFSMNPEPVRDPYADREALLASKPGDQGTKEEAVERELQAYLFGRWDPNARRELVRLWEDAATFAERKNDPIARYKYEAAAMAAADYAMSAWHDSEGHGRIQAHSWAQKGWHLIKPDASFYAHYDKWLEHRLKFGEAVHSLRASKPRDSNVSEYQLREQMTALISDVLQIQRSNWKYWSDNFAKYRPYLERARVIRDESKVREDLAIKAFAATKEK